MNERSTSDSQHSGGFGGTWVQTLAACSVSVACVFAGSAWGQACEKPACASGDIYRDGYCYSYSGPPTFAESRTRAVCEAGLTLDAARGICSGGLCCDKPLCQSNERFTRSETSGGRTYGVCESSSGLGYRSHTLRECQAGWDLIGASGTCRKRDCGVAIAPAGRPVDPRPAEVVRRPDLTIKDWSDRPNLSGGKPVNEVRVGQKYQICFTVANIGLAPSGPFVVQGGGLGVPTGPSLPVPSLAPGAMHEGCLGYSTTPSLGTYRLTVSADARNTVVESDESNNSRTESITVVP